MCNSIILWIKSQHGKDFAIQNNITYKDGVPCIVFIEDSPSKKSKNHATNRIVPINPQLLDLGFLTFIDKMKERNHAGDTDPIYKDMFHNTGTAKDDMTHELTENVFKPLGIISNPDPLDIVNQSRYGFHSFRKNASQHMEDAGLTPTEINNLVGWQGTGTREKHYGNRTFEGLIAANNKFRYDFLQEDFDKWKKIFQEKNFLV